MDTNNADLTANVQADLGDPETIEVPPDDHPSQSQIDAPLDAQNQALTGSDDATLAAVFVSASGVTEWRIRG